MSVVPAYPNWFETTGLANFEKHLGSLSGLRCLQVGVFTGDASIWLLSNVISETSGFLADVDTWEGSDEPGHDAFDWADVERVYDERTARARRAERLVTFRGTSGEFFAAGGIFPSLEEAFSPWFDFVYIDGAHDSFTVLNDAVGAYRLLKIGGLLAFDDYTWPTVGPAVDAFAYLYGDRLELVESNSQAWFRRVR